jgi:hypothetical protein
MKTSKFERLQSLKMKIKYEEDAIKQLTSYLKAGSPQLTFHEPEHFQKMIEESDHKRTELISKYNNLLEKMKIR